MYATDAQARRVAGLAVAEGFDAMVDSALRIFFYLPFGHAESIDDQNRAVALCAALGEPHAGPRVTATSWPASAGSRSATRS